MQMAMPNLARVALPQGGGSKGPNMGLRLLLADDHLVVREGLKSLLERKGYRVVGEASDGREAIELARRLGPDICILDLAMPLLNGVDAAREIERTCPGTKTLLLSMHEELPKVLSAVDAGIRGYVLKSKAADQLVEAIEEVFRGNIYLSPSLSRAVVEAYRTGADIPASPLSPREREVLQLTVEGKTTKEIASLLGISAKTVESHRSRIMDKLGIRGTAGLVRYAIRHGLIEP